MTDELKTLWGNLTRKVLSSVLVDDGAILAIQDILGGHTEWFPIKERPIWEAVQVCLASNIPPSAEAVIQRVNGEVPPGYVQTIANQFNDDDNRRLVYNAEQLRDIGILAQVRMQGRRLSKISDPAIVNDEVGIVSNELGGLLADRANRDAGASSVSESAWSDVNNTGGTGTPTGLKWFDNLTGGMWPGMNYWIVAPYKSGKSTIIRNLVLNAARAGRPVGMFCAEGSREMFALDCQAMLATAIMLDSGHRENLRLSGMFIRRFYWKPGVFSADELEAVHVAKEEWERLPIQVWDTRDGIRDLVTLRYLIKQSKLSDSTQTFFADYSQLFGSGRNLFEKQSGTAQGIQNIAAEENILFAMAAQQNEEQVRSGNKGYSPGVKGGGDAAAAADVMIIPRIDPDLPEFMNVELKLSRHSPTGEGSHRLARASGLIMDKWVSVSI